MTDQIIERAMQIVHANGNSNGPIANNVRYYKAMAASRIINMRKLRLGLCSHDHFASTWTANYLRRALDWKSNVVQFPGRG